MNRKSVYIVNIILLVVWSITVFTLVIGKNWVSDPAIEKENALGYTIYAIGVIQLLVTSFFRFKVLALVSNLLVLLGFIALAIYDAYLVAAVLFFVWLGTASLQAKNKCP